MAWTAPMTAAAGAFTAAQFNTHIRDNLLETAPGKISAGGQLVIASGNTALAAYQQSADFVTTGQSTTSTTYTDLTTTGPSVTVTTGTRAVVSVHTTVSGSNSTTQNRMSFAISGATTLAASDANAFCQDDASIALPWTGGISAMVTLTAGSNTFTAKYRVNANNATFTNRRLSVLVI